MAGLALAGVVATGPMGTAPATAAELTLPAPATLTHVDTRPLATHRVATGPWAQTTPFEAVEGAVQRQVWQLSAPDMTPLQILAPLREQLVADGYEVLLDCETRGCGGYDFRFDIDVTAAPEMFVDLAAYRYLSVRKDDAWVDLVVSTSAGIGYVQQTTVAPEGSLAPVTKSASNPTPTPMITPVAEGDILAALTTTGRAVLADLEFDTGSTTLTRSDYASLSVLADFLEANPRVTIALVGHTDAEGGAAGNMAISRSRADSARALLTGTHGIAANRVETHGVGFFAPLARNDTLDGREVNRRVEVVITSTE
ncbi:OmpA family protein [Jannaschia sp. 2305UL9-9]|uniref:OmpA family protein n=1 Tax=Jannaschia sp. 2305UL9-9 TaxID=3121638 RepID=UPI003527FADC